jgi:apolipoprotein D and lipocalin family protein
MRTVNTASLGLAAALAFAAGSALAQAPQPETADVVKLDYLQYEGRYYEIARLPNWRQRDCDADVVMTFVRRVEGNVSIVYQCFAQDRAWLMDIGLLDVERSVRPGELYIRPDQIGWRPWQSGTYRLIEAPADLSYALVGDAGGSHLWILSRTRQMSPETYARLVARAAERGYDTQKLIRNVQNGL